MAVSDPVTLKLHISGQFPRNNNVAWIIELAQRLSLTGGYFNWSLLYHLHLTMNVSDLTTWQRSISNQSSIPDGDVEV